MKILNVFAFVLFIKLSFSSKGDRSGAYQWCLKSCHSTNCSNSNFDEKQLIYMKMMGWDCKEECKYKCMWKTVKEFNKNGHPTPQFHGKWPFTRLFGMQEPASVLFSVLNAATNVIGFQTYFRAVPCGAPMRRLVWFQLIFAVNTWMWSSVFHSRDFPWTERLDYFCATSLVVFNLYFAIHRVTYGLSVHVRNIVTIFSASLLIALYMSHIWYLTFNSFDYGYNMIANVTVGLLNSIVWLSFCVYKRKTHMYVWKVIVLVVVTNIFLCFELFDFPPILWVLDAHAVWHLSTIPMPILFFSFCRDDALTLIQNEKIKLP